jgi:drug/metabolite transporter (DMT)-like permease
MTGNGGSSANRVHACGLVERCLFGAAIVTGTMCSLCSKTMMQLTSTGITGETEVFEKPLFQTLGMFVGMMLGLVMHVLVIVCRIPFPGYVHNDTPSISQTQPFTTATTTTTDKNGSLSKGYETERDRLLPPKNNNTNGNGLSSHAAALPLPPPPPPVLVPTVSNNVPLWMYFFLAIPSLFDLAATALCMMGLRYLDVSVYQLLRGSGIIFVALMKQHVLKHALYTFQWIGVGWNVVAVALVGAAAIWNASDNDSPSTSATAAQYNGGQALLGILLVMAGACVQALQFVFEEKVMTMENDAAAPPLLLIGMEGLWGTLFCLGVVYPLAYYLPGDDHGSYEDPYNTYHMVLASSTIQWSFLVYFFAIFAYNLFAVLVTYQLNSIWHAILDNFRPVTVWGTDMFIFYALASLQGRYGEPWTKYSWIQLLGMVVLLFGTAVYNAPNDGSIRLTGEWYALGINLQKEYDEIDAEQQEADLEKQWEERRSTFGTRRASSLAEHSPYVLHTQAMRGLASPRV